MNINTTAIGFILDTPNYVESSHRMMGRYLDHIATPEEDRRGRRSGEQMRRLLESMFEDVDMELWGGDIGICWPPDFDRGA